jgi:predicted alpha/beta hydrolase family esterase
METNKPQVIFIHGGNSFDTIEEFYADLQSRDFDLNELPRVRWRDTLAKNLAESFEYRFIQMPNASNANYKAWSIWFEKVVPFLRDGAVLIGHSLGGSFLLRYLSEHTLPIAIAQLHLVAPGVDDKDCPGMGNFSTDLSSWNGFINNISKIFIWHSSDDELVPIHHSERLSKQLLTASFITFSDRGHFIQESFPELEAAIKNQV